MKKVKFVSSRQMSRADAPSHPTRRRALRMGTAGALTSLLVTDQWVRPVVQAVVLPAHASTSPSCDLSLDGCTVTCDSGEGLEFNVYFDYRLYTLEMQDGCPRVADEQRYCCEYDPSLLNLVPGPNQLLITCNQYTYELAPTFVSVSVTLPEQSTPYALGEANCGSTQGSVRTPGGEFEETILIDGVPLEVHAEITVGSGMVTLSQVSVTPL